MQSETADFTPGAATWRTLLNNDVWRLIGAITCRTGRNILFVDSENQTSKFHQMFYTNVTCGRDSLLLWRQCNVMYFRFYEWHHIFTWWSEWARIKDNVHVSSSSPGGARDAKSAVFDCILSEISLLYRFIIDKKQFAVDKTVIVIIKLLTACSCRCCYILRYVRKMWPAQ